MSNASSERDNSKKTDSEPQFENQELPLTPYFRQFLEHLDELRKRLVRAIVILAAGTAIALFFSEDLLKIITDHFLGDDRPFLALLYPTEGFVVRLKISFVTALIGTSPLWFWQIWGFLIPALTQQEMRFVNRVIFPAMLASSFMFVLGAGFGYYVLPYAAHYFESLAPSGVEVYWSLGKYLDFALRLLIAFAIIFELPFIIYIAAAVGVVTPKQLRKHRRHAIVIVFISSAIITPPDLFTQVLLAIPLVLLYEIGILMAMFAKKKRDE